MKRKILIIGLAALLVVAFSSYSFAARAKFPAPKDILTSEVLPKQILDIGPWPQDPQPYLFPDSWCKKADWDAIHKVCDGKKIVVMFEGTDITAPQMTYKYFEELSGAKVTFISVPVSMQFEKLMISYATGSAAYDIADIGTPFLAVFANFLMPLDDFMNKWKYDWDDYNPTTKMLCTYPTPYVKKGGQRYMIPVDVDNHQWHSRGLWLKKAGLDRPPDTLDEVTEWCKKLKPVLPAGMYPRGEMAYRGIEGWEIFWNVAAAMGANFFKPGTWEPDINSPECIAALKYIKMQLDEGLMAPGSVTWDYNMQLQAYSAGKLVMCYQYPIQEAYHPKMAKIAEEKGRIHSLCPKGTGPKGRRAFHGTWSSTGLVVTKASKVAEAAALWGFFHNDGENQYIYTVGGTGIDYGRISLFKNVKAGRYYMNQRTMIESLPYWYNELTIPVNPEFRETGTAAYHDSITGKGTPEENLNKAQAKLHEMMEKYGYLSANPPEPPHSWWSHDYPELVDWAKPILDLYPPKFDWH